MKKNAKRFLSMLLAISMMFGMVVVPAGAAETHDHSHNEEATTVSTNKSFDFTVEDFSDVVLLKTEGVDLDRENPTILTVEKELQNMMVLNADGEAVPLTAEEIQMVLYLFQQYLDQWEANANLLGVQVPFFLQYNDTEEDGLGIMGEMLALAGVPVAAIRAGQMTMDDLVGMIYNFYYGDQLGLNYYGSTIAAKRNEFLQVLEASGAQTDAQRLLVLNDWLAHNVTFDMPYIMNTDKEPGEEPMVAENPQQHENYQKVYDVMFAVYEAQIKDTFEQNIRDGLKGAMMQEFYKAAIKQGVYDSVIEQATAGAIDQALPQVTEMVRQQVYGEAYEAAKTAIEEQIYNDAYNEYLSKNHVHNYVADWDWIEETDGTVTAFVTITCTEGGEVYEDVAAEVVVAEGETLTWAPSCTEAGQTTYSATATIKDANDVEASFSNTIPVPVAALGHDENVVPGKAATCTETGLTDRITCNVCEAVIAEQEEIPAIGHAWDDGVVTTPATEESEGVMTFTCTVCNETKTEVIPALEHVHNYTAVVTAPTCTEDGFTTFTCGCGDVYTDEAVAALGHDEQINTVAATCGADGLKTTTCSRCDYKNEEVLTATGEHADTDADGICDACAQEIPVVEDEDDSNTVDATDEEIAAAEAYAKAAVEAAAEEIAAQAEAVATAEADKYIEENAESIRQIAADAIANDAEAQAQITAVAESETEKFMTENADAINADPVGFAASFGEEAAAEMAAAWEYTWADWEANGIPGMVATFSAEIWPAVIEQFYIQGMMQQGLDEATAAAQAAQIMEADAAAIAADPYAYCVEKFGAEAAAQAQGIVNDQLKQMGIDGSAETNPEGRVQMDVIVALQMDTPQQDDMLKNPETGEYMTPNEAIPLFAAQAAVGLTDGILDYWQGTHIGALGRGTAVCLGYTKAFTYLVQYINPEVYGVNGAGTDMSVSANWKTAEELYYDAEGNLDINANYIVDDVRITFNANVTMYGVTQENFNSDHFWNAVKIDGNWYYADPCYTDVYTEVMIRDRVETDGSMNHLYFIFSHTSAAKLYDGYYSEIKTLYDAVSTNTDYEDSWISRIKSNTYFDGGYAYYIYDSTDLISIMDDYNESQNNNNTEMDMTSMTDNKLKLVRHKLSSVDSGNDGDTNYEALIDFKYKEDEDDETTVVRVYNPSSDVMEESELLTKLFAQHTEYTENYPSIAITMALYNGKAYFNISNVICSYDISTGEVAIVKEYNTVYGLRDKTNPFGGMAFSVSNSSNYDFKIENHPIAAMTIKADGKMYVSVATNFAFISGKDPHNSEDQSSFGYEFEESNFNSAYNTYGQEDYDNDMYESMGYEKEINDNDEFMWTANFVETLTMSHLAGTRHSYEAVEVAAYCGRNAYTENRCTTCGASEPGSRVETEGTALEHHHYVKFEEEYYTKDDTGNWNHGVSYVCTVCGFHIEEPDEPVKNDYTTEEEYAQLVEQYEKELAIYEEAVAIAGHTYTASDAVWAEDDSTVTFSALACSSVCPERVGKIDCLVNDITTSAKLAESVTLETTLLDAYGQCDEGLIYVIGVESEIEVEFTEGNPVTIAYTISKEVPQEPGVHNYVDCVCTVCGNFTVERIAGTSRVDTAIATADALKAKLGVEYFDAIILAYGDNYADALAGSYLATVKNAPILLHRASGAGDDLNISYINANLAEGGTIYILGGTGVMPESLEKTLIDADYDVVRLAGTSRFDTNLQILEAAGVEEAEEILITTGWEFADCLSASATGKPIIMVNTKLGTLTESQIAFFQANADKKFTIIGGTVAVSEEMEATIAELVNTDIERVYGTSREETSIAIAERYFETADFALVAYSRNFPDGLCGGPLAYAYGAPLLLINEGRESYAAAYVEANGIEAGFVLGGTLAVKDASAKAVFGITVEEEIPAL